jgi:hypothetical protein
LKSGVHAVLTEDVPGCPNTFWAISASSRGRRARRPKAHLMISTLLLPPIDLVLTHFRGAWRAARKIRWDYDLLLLLYVVVVGGACEALTKLGIWKITIKSGKMAE